MQASRVSLAQDTLHNSLLPAKRKRQLRQEAIKSVIRDTPAGRPIKIEKLIAAAQFKKYATGWAFVQRMVRDKIITKDAAVDGIHRTYIWTVRSDAKITSMINPVISERPLTVSQIETRAKEYAWKHESDSLRGFIKHLKEKA